MPPSMGKTFGKSLNKYAPLLVWLTYAVFTGIMAFMYHEPWRDEVRALSIARASHSFADLFTFLRNEVHPPLWYFILKALDMVFHASWVLPLASWLVAMTAAGLLLRFAPLPLPVKTLFLCGCLPIYEGVVVARNCGLSLCLMFAFASCYQYRFTRPWLPYGALMLLTLSTIPGAVIAFAFALYAASEPLPRPRTRADYAWPAAVCALIAITAWFTIPDGQSTIGILDNAQPNDVLPQIFLTILTTVILPGGPFRGVLVEGSVFASSLCIFACYAYFIPRIRMLATLVFIVSALNILSGTVYNLALRHEGLMLGAVMVLLWVEREAPPVAAFRTYRRLFPYVLMLIFLMPMPLVGLLITNDIRLSYSSSAALAQTIAANPAWNDAILIGEPDYMLQPLPYYLPNPIYFPRGKTYGTWTRFSRSYTPDMSLSDILDTAQTLHAQTHKPVLLIFEYGMLTPDSGVYKHGFGRTLRWSTTEKIRFIAETHFINAFYGSISDERYELYELE